MVQARASAPRGARAERRAARQLTVRGVDPALDQHLRQEARRRGRSLNQTVLELLRHAAGLEPAGPFASTAARTARFTELDHLAGTWSEEEAWGFDRALAGVRRVDPELWP